MEGSARDLFYCYSNYTWYVFVEQSTTQESTIESTRVRGNILSTDRDVWRTTTETSFTCLAVLSSPAEVFTTPIKQPIAGTSFPVASYRDTVEGGTAVLSSADNIFYACAEHACRHVPCTGVAFRESMAKSTQMLPAVMNENKTPLNLSYFHTKRRLRAWFGSLRGFTRNLIVK